MKQQFHDLSFEQLEDGTVRLVQQSGMDEPNVIHLHPEQVLYVARRLCGLKSETAEQVADLERRISVLTDGLQKLVTEQWFRDDIVKRCGDGIEIMVRLDALLDLAYEFDGGRLQPEEREPAGNLIKPETISSRFNDTGSSDAVAAYPSGSEQLALIGE
jgi:hypothetical protein